LVATVSTMKDAQLTKQDIRDLLEEHTQTVVKPLVRQDIKELLEEHTEHVIKPLIEQSSQRTTEDVVKVMYDFMNQVDSRFLIAENDIKHLKVDYVALKQELEARTT
jgi:hypothetical protein